MYNIYSNSWTDSIKTKLIQDCVNSTYPNVKKYPKEVREYCECIVTNITETTSKTEYIENSKKTKEEQKAIYLMPIQPCLEELTAKIKNNKSIK